jgi:hypothetical protein
LDEGAMMKLLMKYHLLMLKIVFDYVAMMEMKELLMRGKMRGSCLRPK